MSFTASVARIVEDNDNGLLGTHPSWCRVRLDAVVDILNGSAFPSSSFSSMEGKPLIRIRDILNDRTQAFYVGEHDPKYLVQNSELVVGMDGDFNCALWQGPEALLNQRVCRLTSHERFYSRRFLAYVLPGYLSAIHANTSSVTVKHLSSKTIAEIPLPLPPLAEQRRIVAKMEELFTQLDAGVDALKRVKAQLKRYRQAVFKHAFEGELTEAWREARQDELEPASVLLERIGEERAKKTDGRKRRRKELPPLDRSELPELPEGWAWTRVGEVCETTSGGTPSRRNETYYGGDVPWVKSGELNDGVVRSTEESLTFEGLQHSSAKVFPKGTLLIALYGATAGKLGILGTDATTNQAICGIFPRVQLGAKFLYWYLRHYRNQLRAVRQGGAQPNLSQALLRQVGVPLPSFAEQNRIVEEIERCLSIADGIEKDVERSLLRAERLRQSILKRAFEGRLVPQDPSDEPAERLLERIKQEKQRREVDKKAQVRRRRKKRSLQRRLL